MKLILEFIGLIAIMFIVMIITTLMSDSIYKYLYQTECIVFKHIQTYRQVSLNVVKLRFQNEKINSPTSYRIRCSI